MLIIVVVVVVWDVVKIKWVISYKDLRAESGCEVIVVMVVAVI